MDPIPTFEVEIAPPANCGLAVGGPADGKLLASKLDTVIVPVPAAGGFSQAVYKFKFGIWIWERH